MDLASVPAWLHAATDETIRMTLAHCAGVYAQRKGDAEAARVLRNLVNAVEHKPRERAA